MFTYVYRNITLERGDSKYPTGRRPRRGAFLRFTGGLSHLAACANDVGAELGGGTSVHEACQAGAASGQEGRVGDSVSLRRGGPEGVPESHGRAARSSEVQDVQCFHGPRWRSEVEISRVVFARPADEELVGGCAFRASQPCRIHLLKPSSAESKLSKRSTGGSSKLG